MGRFVTWVGRNADGLLVLGLAAVFAVVSWLDLASAETTNDATLLVLAVLAATMLRERVRQGSVESELRDLAVAVTSNHTALDGRLESEHADLQAQLTASGEKVESELVAIRSHLDDSKIALEQLAMVRTLTGREVNDALAEARVGTDKWMFKGGTGTYMRAVTLPECVDNARGAKRRLGVRMEIIDPLDSEACKVYARFRSTLPDRSDGEPWTPDRVRKESFATILAGRWWRQKYHLLDVDIRLSAVVTTLRWDMSTSRLIITQEDPRAPALMVERGRYYYDRLEYELITSHEQARKVPLERVESMTLGKEPTVDETREFFKQLGLELPDWFDDSAVREIVEKVVDPKNPYEDPREPVRA